MRVRVGVRTDIGRARVRNEDAHLVEGPLYAVADGMGGHRGGDVASALALESLHPPGGEATAEDFERLVEQIKEANQHVFERGEADRDLRGMGTTLTAILAGDGKAYVAHVGDSRAYMLRDGKLQPLTEDHTLVQRMVREGRLTEEEARTHPQRSIITRALGMEGDIPIDKLTLDLKPGDRLLLCTDGLTSMVERETIEEILRTEDDPQTGCDRLVEEANRAGGDDNITVIILDVVDDEGPGAEASATTASAPATEGTQAPARATEATERGASEARAGARPRMARPRVRWRRVAVWGGVVAAIIVIGLVGTRMYVDRQWYVGDHDGMVAIYNGIPATVLGFKLSHVQETTDLSATDAERLAYWQGLKDGITADSFAEAQSIVDRIRQDLQGEIPVSGGGG